jgi:hypothetical protein
VDWFSNKMTDLLDNAPEILAIVVADEIEVDDAYFK